MVAASRFEQAVEHDQRVILRGMSWAAYEAMVALRGDASGVRMYYLDGEIELVSPSKQHERRSKVLPKLDVAWLLGFLDAGTQTQAVRAMVEELRGRKR